MTDILNWCIKQYKDKNYLVIFTLDNQGYHNKDICKIDLEKIKNKIEQLGI